MENKTTREDQQMDRVLTLRRLRRPSSVRRRRWHRSRVWQPRQVPPRARGTPRSPAVRSWSPARKKKKKSVGDECNSSVVIGWGRVDEIESVKTMLRENPLSPLSLSPRRRLVLHARVSKHRQMKVVISRDIKHLIMPEGPVIPDACDEERCHRDAKKKERWNTNA